ncbi:MAG: glycosyltransferase family 2 protein [Panacagrimonas sp.]
MTLARLLAITLSRLAQVRLFQPLIPWAKRLLGARRVQGLRARLPAPGPPAPARLDGVLWNVDFCWPIPGLGYLLSGWCLDPRCRVESMRVNGVHELSADWIRTARADVVQAYPQQSGVEPDVGFIALARTGPPRGAPLVEVRHRDGPFERRHLTVLDRPGAVPFIREVLGKIEPRHPHLRALIERHLGPAITAVWSEERALPRPVEQRWFGAAPPHPAVSILIPLYGRYDFLRYQLALFADDLDMQHAELLYVVDDPRILGQVLDLAASLQPLFGLSFAVVHCGRNLGFAGANNLGAGVARGEHLLLLNSDVMPRAPGWLGRTLQALTGLPQVGVVGAQLLYEDGSVQHAGMQLETYSGWGGYAINAHPGKGFAPDPADRSAVEVEAVTGAYMALRRDRYLECGGLDEGYILGDFEDSDLCRRLRQRGLRCWCLKDVELYHLERQSQKLAGEDGWKDLLSRVNCWRHEQLSAGVAP